VNWVSIFGMSLEYKALTRRAARLVIVSGLKSR
jgi:hypothetical protein